MAEVRHVRAREGDVVLLVGTAKGAFVLRSNAARARWETGGPYFAGQAVDALAYDGRAGRRRIWAGTLSWHWGPTLCSSDDFGQSWTDQERRPIRFAEDAGVSVERIWQIRPGRADEPGTLYAGVAPAALFESRDGGESWQLNAGLWNHPHRAKWTPGFGGLCLHTILPDPTDRARMWIAISTGGVYRTTDGGASWQVRNQGVRAQFLPDPHPEFGQCVHKVVMHPARPGRLFLQNHWGLYRSDDGGDAWTDIAKGVPSDFGFCMTAHPHDPETVYIVPLESDGFRCTPEGKLRVYRTRNGGGSWEALTRGLPQKDALETVLRDAMDADTLNPAGIYFGTRSGKLWGSPDGGASWTLIRDGLPPILCVRSAVVGAAAKSRASKKRSASRGRPQRVSAKARPRPARARRSRRRGAAGARPRRRT